jgi:hypothetical protein
MTTMTLRDGYDRSKTPRTLTVRPMTAEEAKELSYGQHALIVANDGTARQVKINGAPKTWKRDPSRVEVPVKYGLYECARLSNVGDAMDKLVVEVSD